MASWHLVEPGGVRSGGAAFSHAVSGCSRAARPLARGSRDRFPRASERALSLGGRPSLAPRARPARPPRAGGPIA